MKIRVALTIAGSDSGGGAGIQADLKTFQALGIFGTSAITSITAQNTQRIQSAFDLPPKIVRAQISAVFEDFEIASVKTGMLSNSAIISAIADELRQRKIKNIVVDPAMISKSGYPLLKKNALDALTKRLLPLAVLVTPNLHEAEILSGMKINSVSQMKEAAQKIQGLGPSAVLIKGGHLHRGGKSDDFFWDGKKLHVYHGRFVKKKIPHGTGCVYSAAITAGLANGKSIPQAIQKAKRYIGRKIRESVFIGRGNPCLFP